MGGGGSMVSEYPFQIQSDVHNFPITTAFYPVMRRNCEMVVSYSMMYYVLILFRMSFTDETGANPCVRSDGYMASE
jgi:hypothetical protein